MRAAVRGCGRGTTPASRAAALRPSAPAAAARRSRVAVWRAARRRSRSCSFLAHPLLESLQGPAQPCGDGCRADPEHACGRITVELQHDAEGKHLALARGERRECRLERGREALDERLVDPLGERRRLLPLPASRLCSEPVERRGAGNAEQPGARASAVAGRTAPRAEAPSRTSSRRDPRPGPGPASGTRGTRRRRRGAPPRPRRRSGVAQPGRRGG